MGRLQNLPKNCQSKPLHEQQTASDLSMGFCGDPAPESEALKNKSEQLPKEAQQTPEVASQVPKLAQDRTNLAQQGLREAKL